MGIPRLAISVAGRRRRSPESGRSGLQPQEDGKPHPRLNTGGGPIANKYREGKMKRTLRRESKALEIVGREAPGASPGAFRAARWWRDGVCKHSVPAAGRCRAGRGWRGRGAQASVLVILSPRPCRPARLGRTAGVGAEGGRGARVGPGFGRVRPSEPAGRSCRPPPSAPRTRGPAPRSRKGDGAGGREGPAALSHPGAGEPGARVHGDAQAFPHPQRCHGRRRGGPGRPVLKHGPRSPTRARAGGPHEPRTRSEGEGVPGSRARSPEVGRLSFGRVRTIGRPGFSRKVRAGARPSGPERSRTMGDQDEARGNSGGGPKRY